MKEKRILIEIRNIKLGLEEPENKLLEKAGKKLRLPASGMEMFRILRRSIDARNKNQIQFVYSIVVEVSSLKGISVGGDVLLYEMTAERTLTIGENTLNWEVVVLGSGPAGMFAALELAKGGYRPILLERGKAVVERDEDIATFFRGGELKTESNIQFGEGGAGTYSDGKLTTRIKDWRCENVFDIFVEMGAPEEILYSHKPHIGTDILKTVVQNIRAEILKYGGEVRFSSKVTNFLFENGCLTAIEINHKEKIPVGAAILAIGHSSRDTYETLFRAGVSMEPKPFAIGLRIEHEQKMLNESQYGKFGEHPRLGASDYSLAMRSEKTGRAAYSFCMCPGGYVVAATSEENQVVVNGMSEYRRDGLNANSALVVNVSPEDFGEGVLGGISFQRKWERAAFEVGGGNYHAPCQTVGSFLGNVEKNEIGRILPTYKPKVKMAKLELCLPEYVTNTLKEALVSFDRKIKGFGDSNALLTGVETRTSAPVRIRRTETFESENVKGLYPCGEGAGYAGGIVSAAVDGIRCAEALMGTYRSKK